MSTRATAWLLAALASTTWAQTDSTDDAAEAPPPASLAELASQSDLVAVVQVADTDYVYARGFPTGGTAFLRVLIRWRLTHPVGDLVRVYDEGLHEGECYFQNPDVGEEGRRHLLFVRDNPDVDNQFLGLPHGCSLEVLVTADNGYALRYPPSNFELTNDLAALARPLQFADPYAVVDDDELTIAERDALLEGGWLVQQDDGRYRFTHGIPLGDLRPLLGEENLTHDRTLLRPTE
ncbi:hypothetical protein F3N42_07860 [Marinihelvus fidelis]|uniref:Uncharacterized protein n=1 Tax=Marinihelvus fidelis TaxID=2613842 RepID=A0A5N0TAN4_9GAMM|nr:hypothetical protein [Marinihelvus fidelis]KAA9132075.1 hypothetical protein F3N42_07860 [Marinihelvus fidelis]